MYCQLHTAIASYFTHWLVSFHFYWSLTPNTFFSTFSWITSYLKTYVFLCSYNSYVVKFNYLRTAAVVLTVLRKFYLICYPRYTYNWPVLYVKKNHNEYDESLFYLCYTLLIKCFISLYTIQRKNWKCFLFTYFVNGFV